MKVGNGPAACHSGRGTELRCLVVFLALCGTALGQMIAPTRIWNDEALKEWATPVATLNVRPGHYSERDYYAAKEGEWLRTYPVYFPGREPEGYWQMLQAKLPEQLIVPGARTKTDWIKAGQIVFREKDVLGLRSYDPAVIAAVRSAEAFGNAGGRAQADGTVAGMRWVPTSKGVAISILDCSGCHTRLMPDGAYLDGAPSNMPGNGIIRQISAGRRSPDDDESPLMKMWRMFAVPWIPDDIHSNIKSMQAPDLIALLRTAVLGTFVRIDGSPYYMTKIPDLIGIGDRRYIDHTATHRLRDGGDVARYAALVTCCNIGDFGPHRMRPEKERTILRRYSDELLFALGEYILSLKPPPNPNRDDPRTAPGRKVFDAQGCGGCHAPPLYTNNRLTLALGYTAPVGHPLAADIMPVSVGTDPGLALKTRKGTGFYKVPSLKGVWYRGLYGHDGSVASLEDWFDPARLRDDYAPTGFKGYQVATRSVKGHVFGLNLKSEDKAALIAFLRTL